MRIVSDKNGRLYLTDIMLVVAYYVAIPMFVALQTKLAWGVLTFIFVNILIQVTEFRISKGVTPSDSTLNKKDNSAE